jgi:hypothetical protein
MIAWDRDLNLAAGPRGVNRGTMSSGRGFSGRRRHRNGDIGITLSGRVNLLMSIDMRPMVPVMLAIE